MAESLIACLIALKQGGQERLDLLNSLLTNIRNADVSHFFILPVSQNFNELHELLIRGYRLGNIRDTVIQSRCQRAQSDFWDLYKARHKNSIAFESPEKDRPVIDFLSPGMDSGWGDIIQRLIRNYFTHLSRAYFDQMWEEFQAETRLHAAFGYAGIDVDNLRNELGRFAEQVTIFLRVSEKAGYVLPERKGMDLVIQDNATSRNIQQL